MPTSITRLIDVRVGDVIVDQRPLLRKIPRTRRYDIIGVELVEGTVVAAASSENGFKVIVNFPDGTFSRDAQYLEVRG